jgi:hypothetical protein
LPPRRGRLTGQPARKSGEGFSQHQPCHLGPVLLSQDQRIRPAQTDRVGQKLLRSGISDFYNLFRRTDRQDIWLIYGVDWIQQGRHGQREERHLELMNEGSGRSSQTEWQTTFERRLIWPADEPQRQRPCEHRSQWSRKMKPNTTTWMSFALTAGLLALVAIPNSPDRFGAGISSIAAGSIDASEPTSAPPIVQAQFNPCPGGRCRR